ncbi:MAG: prolyl oligopeptidase family serine peptidase [Flavobacteriales bacterium]|nr:prolyl oligopeptidase family serine peptidase [Flavobacteriales bacterium]
MKHCYISIPIIGMIVISCGSKKNQLNDVINPPIEVNYIKTRKDTSVFDNYFGTIIHDPYRWLEDDMSEETKQWVEAQNKITFGYLSKISFRDSIKKRLTDIWNYPKYSVPFKEGGYYFYYKNDGLQNQSVLYFMKNLKDDPQVLLDPNTFSADGTTSISGFSVSKDGKYAAYSISEGGSDWNTIKVISLPDKKEQPDVIKWVKFSGIAWYKDGFFYSKFPEPKKGDELKSTNQFQQVYYHKMGTSQTQDQLIYEDKQNPFNGHYAGVTEDERYLILSISKGTYGNKIKVKDLNKGMNAPFITIVDDFDNESAIVDNEGELLYMYTNIGAGKYRLVEINPKSAHKRDTWKEIIPESENVLTGVNHLGGKWIATYLKDASSLVKIFDSSGKFLHDVPLPTMGTVSSFSGKKTENTAYYSFTSFAYPPTIFEYDIEKNTSTEFRKAEVKINPNDYEVKQEFYTSKDGTKIPMFIVHKKGIRKNGNNPTLLYGYGGFDISILPSFSISNMVFLENGGIYAVANLRGGGEYGEAWHKAGMLLNKQNVFDDFIAAAEFLIKEKYTASNKLAIHGRSNGGLLVGAVMTQRPELFKVAVPAVGVLDMLRYHKFTIGHAWAVEYGSSEDSVHFANLLKYSPLHNIKEGVEYPATLIMTADHDDRVVPAHSFKFAATLQEKQSGKNPILIRIDTKAGHGAGKSTSMVIEESADFWAFIFYNLGMKIKNQTNE